MGEKLTLKIIPADYQLCENHLEACSFFGVQLACPDCGFRDSMVREVFDILAKELGENGFSCPNFRKALQVKQAVPMNEVDYNSLLFHPQKFSEQLDRYVRPQEQTG